MKRKITTKLQEQRDTTIYFFKKVRKIKLLFENFIKIFMSFFRQIKN